MEKKKYMNLIMFILDAMNDIKNMNKIYQYAQSLWMEEVHSGTEKINASNIGS